MGLGMGFSSWSKLDKQSTSILARNIRSQSSLDAVHPPLFPPSSATRSSGVSEAQRIARNVAASDPRNPDPRNYEITSANQVNGYLIVDMVYPNCTNYEGRKILMFERGVTIGQLNAQGVIDPHFSQDEEYLHPIARFEPSTRGYAMAVAAAQNMA